MLDQLIVAIGATAGTFTGGLRIGMPPGCGNLCVRRLEAAANYVMGCRFLCRLAVNNFNAAAVVRVHAAAIAICKRKL